MQNTLILLIGIIVAFIVGLFTSKKTSEADAKVLDLTGKIDQNKKRLQQAQDLADKASKEYQDALSKYDPNFYDPNDDGDGKPSA